MELNEKKVLFCDLDGTLIETRTGGVFPKGVWDVKLKLDVWEQIKKKLPNVKYIFIVTNQGGIEKGSVNEDSFRNKLKWICSAMKDYFSKTVIKVDGIYCPTNDSQDNWRKPNIGMYEHMETFSLQDKNIKKGEMLMLGDASGKPGQFSDSDRISAVKYRIDYIDVEDFLAM